MKFAGLDEAALADLAARVAAVLAPGDVVVLSGEVGAGKTTFVRAAARTLGVGERVTSPTYQFARGYEAEVRGRPLTVNHLDLYRLEGIEAPDVLEIDDYLGEDAVTFIEWAEPALGVLKRPTVVELDHETPGTRRVTVTGPVAGRLC
ncbi:tRNA (adenosine(37)-N6)-threonylcarbamoyltransferase complex ATPase subunit type 1 TsaE [Rubrobacter tropicus]|uniref:tRNA (adenosine(37)-N6)-threonylcarbamoyltransferase complex ATPase subunit type 1 TsaE n=1 Tax=Rubrobacter tropicus TaxID=2653851 RepID=UPI001D18BDE0|nr:tRNA (adenosine(37)-N6)-threonylcarbamoyltransferase complex ATPase subunit type 1 TsaE [Rubrobacter tropicus]